MKKTLSSIAIITTLFSCGINDYEDGKTAQYAKESSKKDRLIKPSESMQLGIPKKEVASHRNRDNYYEDYYYENENDDEAIYETNDEINDQEVVDSDEKYRGYFKIGKPYEIYGTTYFPQNYDNFEEVGVASWYGPAFHGKETANGEIYNSGDMTAAHRTLPLPSVARVTNLNNGKTAIVRVNDRGPFAKNRVIDVSERVAEVLEFKNQGTTNIKVELLREKTDEMLEKLNIKK